MRISTLRTLVFFCVLLLSVSQDAIGCEIVALPLRREFKRAERVFQGRVVRVQELPENKVARKSTERDSFATHKLTLEVVRSWKGSRQDTVEVTTSDYCPCPSRKYEFVTGKEFLIYADKKGYVDICNLYFIEKTSGERLKYFNETTRHLDKFWFRTWARIYPF